jgi:hypothetical protein
MRPLPLLALSTKHYALSTLNHELLLFERIKKCHTHPQLKPNS